MRIALAIWCAMVLSAGAEESVILSRSEGRVQIGSDGVVEAVRVEQTTNLLQWLTFAESPTNGAWLDSWDSRPATNGTTGPTWATNAGGVASFDGSNDWIVAGLTSNDWHGKAAVTVMAWVNVQGHNNTNQLNNCVLSSLINSNNTILLQVHVTSNRLAIFGRSTASDSLQSLYSSTFTMSNTWCLVGASLNVSSKVVTAWLNGGVLSSASKTFAASTITTTNYFSEFQTMGGSYQSGSMSRHLNAMLGSWFFFTEEITVARATNLYLSTRARY